jgi:hypothetical protein
MLCYAMLCFALDGEMSFVSANRLSAQLEMKEQESHSLTLQLQQLQVSQPASQSADYC